MGRRGPPSSPRHIVTRLEQAPHNPTNHMEGALDYITPFKDFCMSDHGSGRDHAKAATVTRIFRWSTVILCRSGAVGPSHCLGDAAHPMYAVGATVASQGDPGRGGSWRRVWPKTQRRKDCTPMKIFVAPIATKVCPDIVNGGPRMVLGY